MCAYQVVREVGPVTTWTSQGPAQPCVLSIWMVPLVAASTGVPQGTEKSVPVCQLVQWLPLPPQLFWLVPAKLAGTG